MHAVMLFSVDEIKSILIPPGLKVDGVKFGSTTIDKLIIAALVVPVAIGLLAAVILCYHRRRWQLDGEYKVSQART